MDIDERIRESLAQVRSHIAARLGRDVKIKWVRAENLHVTLKFLGDVSETQLDAVCKAVAEAAGGIESFDYSIHAVQPVPPHGAPRMFWAGVADASGRMTELNSRLEDALANLGFDKENRHFSPHITLARVRFARDSNALRGAAADLAEKDFGTIRAENVTVYTSKLTPQGPIYTPVSHARLKAAI